MNFPLIGNSKIKSSITNALAENRLPHAILIEGDNGLGKHTLAYFLSSFAVCSGEKSPCGNCKNCNLGTNHPDITIITPEDGKKNISVAQVRELKAEAYIKPHMAKRRVFIIDYAHTLNEQSQNALLKVLEEPPESVLFILIVENRSSLLETIISRCIILTLNSPEKNEAIEYLKNTTKYSEDDISNALDSSKNNIGKAMKLLSGEEDSKTAVAAKEFISLFLRGDAFGMLSITAPFEKNRILTDAFFEDLKYYTAEKIRKNPKSYTAGSLSQFYSLIQKLEKSLVTNINLSLLFCTLASSAEQIINNK